jgi:hypothetical protein
MGSARVETNNDTVGGNGRPSEAVHRNSHSRRGKDQPEPDDYDQDLDQLSSALRVDIFLVGFSQSTEPVVASSESHPVSRLFKRDLVAVASAIPTD